MSETSRQRIEHDRLLIVEGKDDSVFFEWLLERLQKRDRVTIWILHGIDNLGSSLRVIALEHGFDRVRSVVIALDADDGVARCTQRIEVALQSAGWSSPSSDQHRSSQLQVRVLPVCADRDGGKLEDVCLAALSKSNRLINCINSLFECAEVASERLDAKRQLQVALAVIHDRARLPGQAAWQNCYDFNHSSLDQIKSTLRDAFD